MPTARKHRASPEIRANHLYQRAEEEWRNGKLRQAFRFFLAAAEAGVVSAFRIVGQFYDCGDGVRANESEALRWYRRAYRNGDYSAANNVGCILRDKGNLTQALRWFRRAVKLGDADANLNIAKLYLQHKGSRDLAIPFLKRTFRSQNATEGSKEEARHLLNQLKKVSRLGTKNL